jgi:hypothetical protein
LWLAGGPDPAALSRTAVLTVMRRDRKNGSVELSRSADLRAPQAG